MYAMTPQVAQARPQSLAMSLQVVQANPQLRTMSKRKDSLLGLAITG